MLTAFSHKGKNKNGNQIHVSVTAFGKLVTWRLEVTQRAAYPSPSSYVSDSFFLYFPYEMHCM